MKKYYLFALTVLSIPSLTLAVESEPLKVTGGGSVQDLINILAKAGGYLLYVTGALAVVIIIISGIRYIVSMGDATQTENAKKTMTYAIVGVVVCALALFSVKIVISLFSGVSAPSSSSTGSPPSSVPANSSSQPSGGTSSGSSSSTLPQWISSKICISVDKCSYNGGTGYMCNKPCCDQFNLFFDSKGKNLCSTGGFTGKGDGKCPSLSISKCQNIWTDPSKAPVITDYPDWAKKLVDSTPEGRFTPSIFACKASNGSVVYTYINMDQNDKYTTYDDKGKKICNSKTVHYDGCPSWLVNNKVTNCTPAYKK